MTELATGRPVGRMFCCQVTVRVQISSSVSANVCTVKCLKCKPQIYHCLYNITLNCQTTHRMTSSGSRSHLEEDGRIVDVGRSQASDSLLKK